jgi:hypothetical protein
MIKEINGRWTCTQCGYEWSACMGDDEVPETCECEGPYEGMKPWTQCVVCEKILDVDDTIKFRGDRICTICAVDYLIKHNKESLEATLVLDEDDYGDDEI